VLELATDTAFPLLERVRLCGIVSSNLDEFFAVRIGGLLAQGLAAAEVLAEICTRVIDLQAKQDALWLTELQPALLENGIAITPVASCGARDRRALARHFERWVEPLLTPIAVGAAAPFPYVRSLALGLAVSLRSDRAGKRGFVCVNVPDDLPRFVWSDGGVYVALEDLILNHLDSLLGTTAAEAAVPFRITRYADAASSEGSGNVLEAAKLQLRRRRFGPIVRLELPAGSSPPLTKRLQGALGVGPAQTFESAAPLGLRAAVELAELPRPDLKHRPWHSVTRAPFTGPPSSDLLKKIRRRDILAQHPYESFGSSVEAFVAAARDPAVAAVKATVYRTGDSSLTLESLVRAAKEEKHAACVVELNARFDERKNIAWSRALERAGVHVVYGQPDVKVHAKLALLVRNDGDCVRRYAHIGTGNYHSSNAASFEDLSLFTADDDIAADVADVFNAITSGTSPSGFRKLLVGPWFLRRGILDEIGKVQLAAQSGRKARIRIKVNSFADPEIANALYGAAGDGVDVQLVVRGICTLRPRLPGLSQRVTVRSVLGRYLEHSRIMSFEAGDSRSSWIGSADLMPRNLDRRVEVMAPLDDERLQSELDAVFEALLADTQFSWELGADGCWTRTTPALGQRPISAQETLMRRARRRSGGGKPASLRLASATRRG
jgi:polyphosphate kinase